jgi:hypothetical protein
MATLHSITSGSFSSASTWGLVDATSLNNSIVGNLTLTTSPVASTAFTPGIIIVKGVSVLIHSIAASPSGTMTVALYNAAGSSVASVTINVSDLPQSVGLGTPYIGWTYFQFTSPVTLAAANAHTLRLNTSVATMVNVYSLATSNWSRALVTTTTQAPSPGDTLLISGQHTAAGTFSPYVVTMDITSNATTYGQVAIGTRGTLSYGVAAVTNYAFRFSGSLYVGQSGTLNIGTTASPIPSTSTATLEILCTSALQYVILVYGTFTTYGATKTIASKLATDVIVGATSSTSTTSTGWKSGDIIVIPSTTRTYTEWETIILNTDATGTSLPAHSTYVAAHGGNATTKVQADVVNATRNITILSASNVFRTNIQMFALSVTSFYYTKFQDLGTGITVANTGISVNVLTTGTFDFQYNVMTATGQSATVSANSALITSSSIGTTISNNLFYRLGWTATVTSTITATIINNNNYFIGCLSSGQILSSSVIGSGNVVAANGAPNYGANINGFFNNATNNSFYSNSGQGVNWSGQSISTIYNTNITGLRIWRNNSSGLLISNTSVNNRTQIFTISDSYIFGNTTIGITSNNRTSGKFYFSNCYIYGGTTLVQPYGVGIVTTYVADTIYFDNCYFGYSDSSLTSSVLGTSTLYQPIAGVSVIFSNCKFNIQADVTYIGGFPMTNVEQSYTALKYNGVTGSNKTWYSNGTLSTDLIIYNNSSPSIRMAPVQTLYKLTQPTTKIPVKLGQTCTVKVKVRKSITNDGAYYNGAKPRLIYSFNPAIGNLTETIGATATNNQYLYPQNFDNTAWSKTACTITPDSGTVSAPDGTFTADLFVDDNTTNRHRMLPNSGIVMSSGTYNISLYAKKNAHDWIQLNPVGGNWSVDWANFNLNTGVIGNKGASTIATMTDAGNGWWRLSIQATLTTIVAEFPVICLSTNNTNSVAYLSYTGALAQCFYIWGAQITLGSTLLPYYDNGSWELLSYTTQVVTNDGVAEFYVDCDGTTGWINVDDWSTTTSNDSRGTDFWNPSGTYIESDWRRPGGSKTFTS